MAWLRYIGGRLESRYRYSIGLVYNPFPWPALTQESELKIGKLAQEILDARAKYPDSTLADFYDPATMPADLRKAHQAVDTGRDTFSSRNRTSALTLARRNGRHR